MPKFLDWAEAAANLSQRGEGYVLVTVLGVKGSAPRDSGTKMLVSADSSIDTIGGGHLEYAAINRARELLLSGQNQQHLEEFPLGPKLGQCCGGRVTLLYECFAATATPVAVFGAGHVGRALIPLLAQLPLRVRWIDSRGDQFPDEIPAGVTRVVASHPEDEVVDLPSGTFVLVMTHQHPLTTPLPKQRCGVAMPVFSASSVRKPRPNVFACVWSIGAFIVMRLLPCTAP